MRENERRTPEERRKLQERFEEKRDGDKDIRRLEQLGRNIRGARARAGLQQDEVAHKAGLAVAQFARTERGVVNCTALTLVRIAGAIGVEVGVLFQDIQ